ncbi:hypothetical protein J4E91_000510 [Alternaria rosae]|nr:hypothetical protein J4E91_000510 [Alternaria rosae]
MATDIIYIVLRFQLHLRTAQQIRTGGKRRRPSFSWAKKIRHNQDFAQPEDRDNTYDEVEVEAADDGRRKTMLVHSRSCEEDIRIFGHSPIMDVAQQHQVDEVKKHIGEFKQAGTKVTEDPESLWDVSELNDHMVERTFYVAHQPMTLDDGTASVMTRW